MTQITYFNPLLVNIRDKSQLACIEIKNYIILGFICFLLIMHGLFSFFFKAFFSFFFFLEQWSIHFGEILRDGRLVEEGDPLDPKPQSTANSSERDHQHLFFERCVGATSIIYETEPAAGQPLFRP